MSVTIHSLSNLARAIEEVSEIDLHMWTDLGPRMTCTECDSVTGLLDALGLTEQARRLYDAHCVDEAEEEPDDGEETLHRITGAELIIKHEKDLKAYRLRQALEAEMTSQRG